ncbi:PTS sugar transporter subunit IIA [Mycoplasma sp. E35C]|uniref:PTS sugar transporter subunit IIA n=1 Tax=Mycoplasma sp. E35C TaxID=2801918 RepID=UPI00210720FA|nr:PTS sugar transporter subunit IIA [Mycoplasma sp. E35C]
MNKATWVFLNIITLGIIRIVANKKAKRMSSQVNQELKISNKLPFNLDNFVRALGSWDNLQSSEATLNMIKISVVDKNKINPDQIKKEFKIKGIMWSGNNLSLVCGDYAISLSEQINSRISK